ncbi:MAG TPA: DUF1028 domain-containing protein [Chitinophagales bacterium]|nr:DUF1028 domain-containing protein [Chitinophagales bacterium]
MKTCSLIFLFLLSSFFSYSQQFYADPFAHTFSIVARDPVTGEMGVAVQSHWFSVGTVVSWAEAGVGAIATQSFVNPALGQEGLQLLKEGKTAREVLDLLIGKDEGRAVRQLAVLDAKGRTATYTGEKCIPEAGHISEENFSVQANLMLNDKVWPAMAAAFKKAKGPLAERMIVALEAGQAAGGDIRGKQSAAILVVKAGASGKLWEDREIDLEVADHPDPIKELKRLLQVHRAYEHMNAGDLAVEKNDMPLAMQEYATAENLFPENLEMKFWHAVTMVNNGMTSESLPLFKTVFEGDKNWRLLIPRLRKVGQLNCDDKMEKLILSQ